jgi:hypothetical protein
MLVDRALGTGDRPCHDCAIEHGGQCTCTPEIFFTIDGRTVEMTQMVA